MTYKNILITGGLGLIGSHIVDCLLADGMNVTILDNLSRGKRSFIGQGINNVKLVMADILDVGAAKEAFVGQDIVVHLASKVLGVGYSHKSHPDMLFYNDKMTNAFFDLLDHSHLKYLVVCSSSCVYPDDGPESVAELEIDGLKPEMANEGYGLAKKFLEMKSQLYSRQNNIPLLILRPFNIYGERYTWAGNFSQAIPMLVKKVLDGNKEIEVWGSGNQRRNYMHAADCARIINNLIQRQVEGVINIGFKETISLKELVLTMKEVFKLDFKLKFNLAMPEGRYVKSADDTKLLNILPHCKKNFITLEEGLRMMQTWYDFNFKK